MEANLTIANERGIPDVEAAVRLALESGRAVNVRIEVVDSVRSGQQCKSIEVYCRSVATALNDAGYDQMAVLEVLQKKGISVPNTQESVKKTLWHLVQRTLLGVEKSSSKLATTEVSRVYEVMNRATAERFGISLPFPDRFSQADQHGSS